MDPLVCVGTEPAPRPRGPLREVQQAVDWQARGVQVERFLRAELVEEDGPLPRQRSPFKDFLKTQTKQFPVWKLPPFPWVQDL